MDNPRAICLPSDSVTSSPLCAIRVPWLTIAAAAIVVGASTAQSASSGGTNCVSVATKGIGASEMERAIQLIGPTDSAALACYFELLQRLVRLFDRSDETVSTRLVDKMPDEGDGPYVFVDVRTERDAGDAYAILESFERSWWIGKQRLLPRVNIALRFS
jgi:hypothetical protein